MRYNLLGQTGVVSELCPGTMTFSGAGTYSAIGTLDFQNSRDPRGVGRAPTEAEVRAAARLQ